MRYAIGFLAALLLIGSAAGQTNTTDLNPGLIGPGNPLYGVELTFEDTFVGTPIGSDPGKLAQERASEAKIAVENGLNQSFQRANRSLNRVARVATNKSSAGLQKAKQILGTLQTQVPNGAHGLNTAISSLTEAMNRTGPKRPGNSENPSSSGRQRPDSPQP